MTATTSNGVANLFPIASGHWSDAAIAGVFDRYWYGNRSFVNYGFAFRAASSAIVTQQR